MQMGGYNTKKTGDLGEDIACKYLQSKGFEIVERNYSVPYGEIDIVTKKKGVLRFVEVKTVFCSNEFWKPKIRPEEKVDSFKYDKISKVAETYLHQNVYTKHNPEDVLWQIDVVAITLIRDSLKAKVKFFEKVIFDRKH